MGVETRVAWPANGYAGFWQRVGGYLVDALIFAVVSFLIAFVAAAVAAAGGQADPQAISEGVNVTVNLLAALAFFLYDTVLTARQGATLGKRAVGIEVRTPDGALPSYGRCVGRYFARFLSALPLGLGYLWPIWDERKQTFHDKIATTVVVQRKLAQPTGGATSGWATGAAATGGWGAPAPAAERSVSGPAWSAPAGTPQEGEPPTPTGGLAGDTMESARWGADASPAGTEPNRQDVAASWGEPSEPSAPPEPSEPSAPPERPEPVTGERAAGQARDPNLVAIERASLSTDAASWLRQVAAQVDPRLDRVDPGWRSSPQSDAARACAFGILLGHLARAHPHMAADLGRVAEVHPSFSTLLEGSRLATLEQIAEEPGRATAWLGPLIDVDDRDRIAALLS